MFQRMLVTLDGSKLAAGVLPYATSLAKVFNTWVTLLSVVPHEESAEGGDKRQQYLEEMERRSGASLSEYLHTMQARLREQGVKADFATRTGNVPQNISSFAEEGKYDLIAIATRGRSGITRWLMGSVADHVLQSTSIATLLIKPEDDQSEDIAIAPIKRLLVPLDGSPIAEVAIPIAEQLASKTSAKVHLVQALPTMSQLYLGIEPQAFPTDVMQSVEESAVSYLQGMTERLQSKGISATSESPMGDPASIINDLARKLDDSIVVMSTRGRTGFSRWILGSVADKVVRGSTGPVLLVRPLQEASG